MAGKGMLAKRSAILHTFGMSNALTEERAKLLFARYESWFGPPALWFGESCIDGRVRMAVIDKLPTLRLKKRGWIPKIMAKTDQQAAALLMLNGHHARAIEHVPEALRSSISDIAVYCDLDREDVSPVFVRQRVVRMKAHTTPRRREVIEKLTRLLREGEQSVDGRVRVEQIREVLGPWL